MLWFFEKCPCLGVEITSSSIRLSLLSGKESNRVVADLKTVELPAGTVVEGYASLNIQDMQGFANLIREGLSGLSIPSLRRAALALPDAVFRVQLIEFDEFPKKTIEQERLVRWRLEKNAFDVADTLLRYQVVRQQDKSVSVLACMAKQAVLTQYESVLINQGLEPWCVAPSSFHIFNFFKPHLSKISPISALVHVSTDAATTIIAGLDGIRLYRYKDVKRGPADKTMARLVREIADSIHFYNHLDKSEENRVKRIYLTGDNATATGLLEGLQDMIGTEVEVPAASLVIPSAKNTDIMMVAALGAGACL